MRRIVNIFRDGANQAIAGGAAAVAGTGMVLATGNPVLGILSAVAGAGVGLVLRPRSEDEIAKLTGQAREITHEGVKAITSGDKDALEQVLREAEEGSTVEPGSVRDDSTRQRDLDQANKLLAKVRKREGTIGPKNARVLADIFTDMSILINNTDFLNQDITVRTQFDGILYKTLPDTLDIFLRARAASSKTEEVDAEFAEQLRIIQMALTELSSVNERSALKSLKVQSAYVEDKYVAPGNGQAA